MIKRFALALLLSVASFVAQAADVRFSNNTNLGLNGFTLWPHNGNAIRAYDPTAAAWVTVTVPNAGFSGVVSSMYIDDVAGQNMPYNTIHIAFLKIDASGNPYINWLTWAQAGLVHGPEGFFVDARTQRGHVIGMAIRVATFEIQGQYNSEYLLSYYNRGSASFFSVPACTVAAGAGWQPCGVPVELLTWADDFPQIVAQLNFTGTSAGASLQGALVPNGAIAQGAFTAATNASPGNPYSAPIVFPTPPINPGFYSYRIYIQTNAGTVTLGAALNSMMNVYGKF